MPRLHAARHRRRGIHGGKSVDRRIHGDVLMARPRRTSKGHGMNRLMYVIFAILVAFVGCWASVQLLPPGIATTLGEVLSVLAGFGMFFGGPHWFHD